MVRAVLGALVLLVVGLAAPAPAASTYGTVSGINGVLYDDCRSYPFHYSVNVPDTAGYRDLEATLIEPDGRWSQTVKVYPDTDVATGVGSFVLCTPTDRYGTYTIRAKVEWGPDAQHPDDFTSTLDDAHFSMRKPYTRTALSVSTRRPAYGQVVRYRISVWDERPTGYHPTAFAWVVLQKRVDGRWVRIRNSRTLTHSTGRVSLRLTYRHRHTRMRIRAVTQEADRYARSTSPAVRLW